MPRARLVVVRAVVGSCHEQEEARETIGVGIWRVDESEREAECDGCGIGDRAASLCPANHRALGLN